MRLQIDKPSYQIGYGDGKSGASSKSHGELIQSGLDDLSYLSGFIEGEGRRITGSEPTK
jgi:hypothetical protein